MANELTWGKAGLVFLEDRDIDIVATANHVASGFEAMGHTLTGVHILSDTSAQISTDSHDLTLDLRDTVSSDLLSEPGQTWLCVKLAGNCTGKASQFATDAILARCLQTLNATLCPDFVQWKDANFLLPSDRFATATQCEEVSTPDHTAVTDTGSLQTLPDVETTHMVLQDRLSNHDPDIFDCQSAPERLREMFSDGWVDPAVLAAEEAAEAHAREMEDIEEAAPLRLSAWFFSFAVLLFALPVGVALLIVNIAKGENLRLSSQTAALTGVFVAFQSMGTTANAMAALQQFVQ
ncbi:MAG: hypothetical protein AAF382_15715 [Pseudomonadota bacterium]